VSDEGGKYQFVVPEGKYEIKVSSLSHKLVTNMKKGYKGQVIEVVGKRPRMIVVKVVVEVTKGQESEQKG